MLGLRKLSWHIPGTMIRAGMFDRIGGLFVLGLLRLDHLCGLGLVEPELGQLRLNSCRKNTCSQKLLGPTVHFHLHLLLHYFVL